MCLRPWSRRVKATNAEVGQSLNDVDQYPLALLLKLIPKIYFIVLLYKWSFAWIIGLFYLHLSII